MNHKQFLGHLGIKKYFKIQEIISLDIIMILNILRTLPKTKKTKLKPY